MSHSSNHEDYSKEYRKLFVTASLESTKLGLTRDQIVSEENKVSDDVLRKVSDLLDDFSQFLDTVCPGYWGNLCQTLSTNIFAFLNARGIAANIIIGNVFIQENDEFEVTLDSLREEYLSVLPLTGHQALHAWVSIGDDTIIDAALPPRLVKHYRAPAQFEDMIFIGRASTFAERYHVRYRPLIIGTEFFAKTNPPDPMELLNSWRSAKR